MIILYCSDYPCFPGICSKVATGLDPVVDLTLQLSFCGGASLLLLRPLRLGSSLLRARVTARSLRPRSFFRSDSFLFLSEIYPSTKARKGDGEYGMEFYLKNLTPIGGRPRGLIGLCV